MVGPFSIQAWDYVVVEGFGGLAEGIEIVLGGDIDEDVIEEFGGEGF
jgi:hypothetical protein